MATIDRVMVKYESYAERDRIILFCEHSHLVACYDDQEDDSRIEIFRNLKMDSETFIKEIIEVTI